MTVQVVILGVKSSLKRKGSFRLVVYGNEFIPHDFQQGFRDLFPNFIHSHGMELHDGNTRIIVNDKSRKIVTFPMNESVDVVVRVGRQTDSHTCQIGLSDAFNPEVIVNFLFLEREYTHGDTPDLVVARGEIFVVTVIHLNDVTFLYVPLDFGYCSREDPRVQSV